MIPNYKYKTSLCKYFMEKVSCPLEQKCHYAHGAEELRAMHDVN